MSGVKLIMYLDYGSLKRVMTVAYAPGGKTCYSDRTRTIEPVPMLRVANRMLLEAGFNVGAKVSVEYGHDIITVRKLQNHGHNNISETNPVTDPTTNASSAVDATTGDGYTGPRASDSQRNQEAMRNIQPLRYVLRGHWHTVSAQDARINRR